MFARVSATISTERGVGIGAVVCCRAAAKEYRHGKGLCDRAHYSDEHVETIMRR
jgi:hypothetical protein